jgi:multidrug efflux pump subunit AcrA (membrane-fusion protein)
MNTALVRVRRSLPWLIVLGGGAAAVYFVALRPTEVWPYPVSTGTVSVEALGTGSVESRRMVQVSFEVTGRVTRIDRPERPREGGSAACRDRQPDVPG